MNPVENKFIVHEEEEYFCELHGKLYNMKNTKNYCDVVFKSHQQSDLEFFSETLRC